PKGVVLAGRALGEVEVRGHGFLGYLGDPRPVPAWLPTGDLGRLDAEGFLTLTGRLKSCFITAFGRNIAPEWVERELVLQPPVRQAAVFGEGRPWNAAVLVAPPDTEREALAAAVERANRGLPDYARVYRWVVAEAPFTPENGLLTATGTVRREAVWRRYGPAVDRLYDDVAVA
ncbi:MAG: long-chain acyl-CoA synthetase, partial [Nitrospirae bacterium]